MPLRPRYIGEVFAEKSDTAEDNPSIRDQKTVETSVMNAFKAFNGRLITNPNLPLPKINRQAHVDYLKASLFHLSKIYECLDASQPWICFWILNSLWLLDDMPDNRTLSNVVKFLRNCQHKDGGYGGGPNQYPHLASTYAAVNALCIIGTKEAYESINRATLQKFLWDMRTTDGSFAMHEGGEVDVRGVYCALNVAKLTNVYSEALFDRTAEWVVTCQTYEGGFGSSQGMEAHGGYAFCAISSLSMLGRPLLCDIDALLRWCANRQMKLEGGFQGRTNKLVDGCYSFWQGAIFPILHTILFQGEGVTSLDDLLFDETALQEYVMICCENPKGGFIDKPGKLRDLYHTNYDLSGIAIAQHSLGMEKKVLGHPDNELKKLHPIHCIGPHLAYNASHYFTQSPMPDIN